MSPQSASSPGPGVRIVRVDAERDGQRIDNFLLGQLKGAPRSLIYRILRTGQVRINGRRAKPEVRLSAGDEVRIPPVRVAEREGPAQASEGLLDLLRAAIVFEDRDILALNKPAGLAAHGGSGIVLGAIEALRQLRDRDTLELVHRLDRDTSGVLVLARRRSALTELQKLIRENKVRKQYLALLCGRLGQDRISVNAPLEKQVLQGGERMVRVDPAGKASLSHFKVLKRFAACTLVEVHIETGRTHQIRVHSAHLGHPVAGDEKYGDKACNRQLRELGLSRMFLHAASMQFALKDGAQDYLLHAPLPQELGSVIDRLEKSGA